MQDIICPNCKKAFKIDEAGFADILKQVRDHKFQEELNYQLKTAVKLAEADKQTEIIRLKSEIDRIENEKKYIVNDAIHNTEKSLTDKFSQVINKQADDIRMLNEENTKLKDFKLKRSTKMVGESLEEHCETEFNKLRATGFRHAYFEKDNDSKTGSKGDYIYRETDESGLEFISIMFEMKNEQESTVSKHKNEDYFKELDKDRNEKNCEYAVLVSLLEADSDLYNTGIVDVSYRFPKMYVVRPQFFIPIITILRNAASNSLKYQSELAVIRNQNIDITTFEADVNNWKSSWLNSMKNAGKKHSEALEQIEKAIKDLEKVREALTISDKHLASAETKMEDLTIKRLTRNNPTMQKKFAEISGD